MNKRKIIIISRDDENYGKDNPLANLLKNVDSTSPNSSYLHSFDYIKSKYKSESDLVELLRSNDIKPLKEARDFFTQIITSNADWYPIPNELIKCQDNNNLYARIQNGYEEVLILFYNRTKKSVNGNPALLLSLVFMDCGNTDSDGTENLLYIHDEEFGIKENKLLVFDGKIDDTVKNQGLLQELVKRKFTYVAAFKHEIGNGRFFDQILKLDFGKKPIADEMKKIEEDKEISDFATLKSRINNIFCNDTSQI